MFFDSNTKKNQCHFVVQSDFKMSTKLRIRQQRNNNNEFNQRIFASNAFFYNENIMNTDWSNFRTDVFNLKDFTQPSELVYFDNVLCVYRFLLRL